MLDEGRARKPDDEENGDQRTFASVRLDQSMTAEVSWGGSEKSRSHGRDP